MAEWRMPALKRVQRVMRCYPGLLERAASAELATTGFTPSFKSVFQSTLLTEAQHTITKALDFLQERSPGNAGVVSGILPQLQAAHHDKDGMALLIRDLFIALEPRDDFAAAEIHWHECAGFMALLDQDFRWALRRSAEALLDRRLLEAILWGATRVGRRPRRTSS
jgi:hypothetical protein